MIDKLVENYLILLSNFNIKYKRYFFHKIDFREKLIGIIGARGVGKTTALLQYLKESDVPLEKKLYISADSVEIADTTLFEVAKEFSQRGGKILVIDEIHKYPDFQKNLKQIYDFLDIQVIFSGSSAIRLEHSRYDLSRRAVLYRVNGLSFREFLEMKTGLSFRTYSLNEILTGHTDIAMEISSVIKPLQYFKEYIEKGFYPFFFESPSTYLIKLEETINTTIESDIGILYKVEHQNIIKLKKLVKMLCSSEPFELNLTRLANSIDIDRQTLYKYMEYLHLGNIIFKIDPKTKGKNIFSKPEKVYLNNTNLYFAYCTDRKIGTIRECFAVSMLRESHTVSYWKDKGDFLVDDNIVIEIGGKNKDLSQVKDSGFVFADDIQFGTGRKIPLWLLGFLY